jgi:uncharacterized protein (UPF0332 family)
MNIDKGIDLAKGRIQVAYDRLQAAEDNLAKSHLRDSLHSAYYAAYTAIRVLLNLEHEEQRKHSGNIGEFRRLYIKTGILEQELSSFIGDLYRYRDIGDYDLDFIPEREIVVEMVDSARKFIEAVNNYLNANYFCKKKENSDNDYPNAR